MIPTREQFIESEQIAARRQYARELYVNRAIVQGMSKEQAEKAFYVSRGETISRNQEMILRHGGFGHFTGLFMDDTLVAWEKIDMPDKHGRIKKFWVFTKQARDYFGRAYSEVGRHSRTNRALNLVERECLLPCYVAERSKASGVNFVVDEIEMEHLGMS